LPWNHIQKLSYEEKGKVIHAYEALVVIRNSKSSKLKQQQKYFKPVKRKSKSKAIPIPGHGGL
jgi:hypothetical protein